MTMPRQMSKKGLKNLILRFLYFIIFLIFINIFNDFYIELNTLSVADAKGMCPTEPGVWSICEIWQQSYNVTWSMHEYIRAHAWHAMSLYVLRKPLCLRVAHFVCVWIQAWMYTIIVDAVGSGTHTLTERALMVRDRSGNKKKGFLVPIALNFLGNKTVVSHDASSHSGLRFIESFSA